MTTKNNPALRANAGNRAVFKAERDHNRTLQAPCKGRPIDFDAINKAALAALPAVLARLLPNGKRVGAEIVAINPRRSDRHLGSFKVNRYTGRWADFATDDKGGDVVSLVAYLADVSQGEAARLLALMLGLGNWGRRHG